MENTKKESSIDIIYIIRVFLSYWPILGLSSFLFLSAGIVYFKYVPRNYSVSAKMVINTSKSGGLRGANEYVNVNELMIDRKELSNEINILKSSPLIKEVIYDMNLLTTYYDKPERIPRKINFGQYETYKSSPFMVVVDENAFQPIGVMFTIYIFNDETFYIKAYNEETTLYRVEDEKTTSYHTEFDLEGTYKFGEQIKNKNCSFKVLLNSNYLADDHQERDLFFKFNSAQSLAYKFQKSLTINGAAYYESSVAILYFEWGNVSIAKEFLSNLIDKYIQKNLDKKNFNANNTIEYIEQQLANVQSSLGQSESRLQNFRTASDVLNIDQKTSNLYSQILVLERSRDDLQLKYQNLGNLKEYFIQNKNSSTFIAPMSMGMSDATLATLIQELTSLSREKQDLISTNQLKNPRIKTLDASMASIKKVISDNIDFSISAARHELTDINERISALNYEYSKLPQTQRQLQGLERDFNINDEVYSSLLNQRIQAKIMKASNRSDSEILEPVKYDMITSPDIKMIAVMSLFLGMFFPSLYIIIFNFLTPQIKSKEDLSNFCPLPVIGDIPHNDGALANVINNMPQSPIVERFHSIRSNLLYYLYGEKNKCILITSTLPNEGKSFISLNMAMSFASTNNKTLLINFDLRKKSKILKEMNITPLIGLDLFLINGATINDIIYETPYPNLDFVHNGKLPPDPVSLLSSPRLTELFEIAKEEYDYVIVDTPPFGMVTDAFLLMKYADIKLFVSRLGIVTKKAIKQSMEELKAKDIKDIHLIRNDLSKLDKTYADKYAYGEPQQSKFSKFFGFLRKK